MSLKDSIRSKSGKTVVFVNLLWLKDLRVGQWTESCIGVNTRELNRELYIGLSTLYTKILWSVLTTSSLP